jgi:hypothetical protein
MENIMTPVAIKTLTTENWLQPDTIPSVLTKWSLNDHYAYLMTAEDWVTQFIDPKLNVAVPDNVQVLFEVARGALAYGYFFYPLYTLAAEQLFRVGEAAISAKYLSAGGPNPKKSFQAKVEYLRDKTIITASSLPTGIPFVSSEIWFRIRKDKTYFPLGRLSVC